MLELSDVVVFLAGAAAHSVNSLLLCPHALVCLFVMCVADFHCSYTVIKGNSKSQMQYQIVPWSIRSRSHISVMGECVYPDWCKQMRSEIKRAEGSAQEAGDVPMVNALHRGGQLSLQRKNKKNKIKCQRLSGQTPSSPHWEERHYNMRVYKHSALPAISTGIWSYSWADITMIAVSKGYRCVGAMSSSKISKGVTSQSSVTQVIALDVHPYVGQTVFETSV